ncbi:MAG: nitroreductase family protein [Acidimicrobiales bacterium]|nr:nitroreductase family protein [Acidimicrobiales bacterium]
MDVATADHLLTTTRAVRRRLDLTRPVPRPLVLECLRAAIQAPTGGNVQRWRWLVVDDPDLKAGLARVYRKAFEPYIEVQQRLVAEVGRTDRSTAAVIASALHLAEHLQDVPVLVIPCTLDRLPPDASVAAAASSYGSILPAVWSYMLAARARGLGTAWTTLHLEHEQEAAELLGIPPTVTQVALIPTAFTVGDTFKPATRRPVEEVTYWNGWPRRS